MTVLDILLKYYPAFFGGLYVTLQMCVVIWAAGIVLGAVLGFYGARYRVVGVSSRMVSYVLSAVPILVFLFWLHYPIQAAFDVVINPFYTATFTFCIINMFGVADIVRGVLADFPRQYQVAAQVAGMSERQILRHIVFPLALRQVLPPLILLQVMMLHVTLFASLISVEEIFRVAQRINAQIYRPVEIYTALGLFFLVVCLPVNLFAYWLRAKFTRDTSEH